MERSSDVSRELVTVVQAAVLLLITAERLFPVIQQRVTTQDEKKQSYKRKEKPMTLEMVIRSIFSTFFLASVIRISTPIILPCHGWSVRHCFRGSNMALEGIMLWGAFTGVLVSAYTGNVWLAVLAGLVVGILVSMILAVFHLGFGVDLFLAVWQ